VCPANAVHVGRVLTAVQVLLQRPLFADNTYKGVSFATEPSVARFSHKTDTLMCVRHLLAWKVGCVMTVLVSHHTVSSRD
jgi:hypothetical protein